MIHYKQQPASQSSESGFTIIESLMAIVVVAILMTAIAPVIILSVATRLQARRVELATDAAKAYIDGVRSGTIPAPPVDKTKKLQENTAPTVGSLTCSNGNNYCSTPATNLYCVDADGGGCSISSSKDLVIQAFGYNKNSTDDQEGYQLGIRVYRADGFRSDGGDLKRTYNPTEPDKSNKQATFAGGAGDRKTPLFEMTTEISNKSTSFGNFCDRLKPPDFNPTSNPKPNPQSEC